MNQQVRRSCGGGVGDGCYEADIDKPGCPGFGSLLVDFGDLCGINHSVVNFVPGAKGHLMAPVAIFARDSFRGSRPKVLVQWARETTEFSEQRAFLEAHEKGSRNARNVKQNN